MIIIIIIITIIICNVLLLVCNWFSVCVLMLMPLVFSQVCFCLSMLLLVLHRENRLSVALFSGVTALNFNNRIIILVIEVWWTIRFCSLSRKFRNFNKNKQINTNPCQQLIWKNMRLNVKSCITNTNLLKHLPNQNRPRLYNQIWWYKKEQFLVI